MHATDPVVPSGVLLHPTPAPTCAGHNNPLPGWELREEHLWFEGHTYIPEPLHLQLICNHHNHPTAGHFGHCKTIDLIHCSYHWPGLTQMVKQYIRSCTVCACSKANQHKPWLPQTTANPPMPMGIHFYGFHQTTSNIRGTHCDIGNSQLPNQTIPFHPYP